MRNQYSPPSPVGPTSFRRKFPIVGVGASAAGLAALKELLQAMPTDAGIALVVVQHLARDKPGLAAELLARSTPMQVCEVVDEPTIEPGRVYIIPPGKCLGIVDGKLRLAPMEAHSRRQAVIDYFFKALAKDQRECAVGVILSGTGSDGALGVKAIKEAGGLVLVQDVDATADSGMPEQAIPAGVVDQVLTPAEIPQALLQFARHDYLCSDSVVQRSEGELAVTTGTEQAVINQSELAQQEFKAGNEGVMSINEALQSSNEELRQLSRSLESQVRERTELLELLQQITRIANEAVSVDRALNASMAKITEYSGWCVGHVWRLTQPQDKGEGKSRMESSGIWYINPRRQLGSNSPSILGKPQSGEAEEPAAMESRFDQWQRSAAGIRFSQGDGLIGRVMKSGQTQWVSDIQRQPEDFPAELADLGVHAAVALPITIEGEVVAVMELYSQEAVPPQERFLEILSDIGIQLGHVINRQRLQSLVANIAEAEQRRIGRELHDRVAQQLTGGALIAQSLKFSLPKDLKSQIASCSHLVDILNQAHHDVRALSTGLMPEPITAADLIPALRGLAVQTGERFQLRCQFEVGDFEESLMTSDTTANLVYLIVCEALHNIVKHASAEEVKIHVSLGEKFRLMVSDDGQGFETGRHRAKSNGLRIMRYRAESVGGDLEIESTLHQGTRLILTIPQRNC